MGAPPAQTSAGGRSAPGSRRSADLRRNGGIAQPSRMVKRAPGRTRLSAGSALSGDNWSSSHGIANQECDACTAAPRLSR